MKDMMSLMKQAQEMQKKMEEAQAGLESVEVTGSSGGGAVEVVVNARGEARRVRIDPELARPDEVEILEDLIVAAMNDAKSKAEQEAQKSMQDAMGGLGGMGALANMFGGGSGKGPF